MLTRVKEILNYCQGDDTTSSPRQAIEGSSHRARSKTIEANDDEKDFSVGPEPLESIPD